MKKGEIVDICSFPFLTSCAIFRPLRGFAKFIRHGTSFRLASACFCATASNNAQTQIRRDIPIIDMLRLRGALTSSATQTARRTCAQQPAASSSSGAASAAAGAIPDYTGVPFWRLPRREALIVCAIFGITGSTAAFVARPALRSALQPGHSLGWLGIDPTNASFWNGPWSYRLIYFCILCPAYSLFLVTYGAIFGRALYFRFFAFKMWARYLPAAKRPALAERMGVAKYAAAKEAEKAAKKLAKQQAKDAAAAAAAAAPKA
jgi:hypothetical protein